MKTTSTREHGFHAALARPVQSCSHGKDRSPILYSRLLNWAEGGQVWNGTRKNCPDDVVGKGIATIAFNPLL